jgi:hypothetical protein
MDYNTAIQSFYSLLDDAHQSMPSSSSAFKTEFSQVYWNNTESIHFLMINYSKTKNFIIHNILDGDVVRSITGDDYYDATFDNYKYIILTENETSTLSFIFKITENVNANLKKVVLLIKNVLSENDEGNQCGITTTPNSTLISESSSSDQINCRRVRTIDSAAAGPGGGRDLGRG